MTDTSKVERLVELLAERMERELVVAERAELDTLLRDHPDWSEDDLELTAAAVDLAFHDSPIALPEALRGALLEDAASVLGEERAEVVNFDSVRPRRAGPWVAWSGWAVAAAAVAFLLFSGEPLPEPESVVELPSAAERRAALAAKPETLRLEWSATEDPLAKGVRGDVVWSADEQEGYLRFEGLVANDPERSQYQLWIFDAQRNEAHPVDGGVFDSDGGEVVVPIDPRVPVGEATLFAVTLERPGGVVVSTRERLVLIAKPG